MNTRPICFYENYLVTPQRTGQLFGVESPFGMSLERSKCFLEWQVPDCLLRTDILRWWTASVLHGLGQYSFEYISERKIIKPTHMYFVRIVLHVWQRWSEPSKQQCPSLGGRIVVRARHSCYLFVSRQMCIEIVSVQSV